MNYAHLRRMQKFTGSFLREPETVPFSYQTEGKKYFSFENCENVTVTAEPSDCHISRVRVTGKDRTTGLTVTLHYAEYREFPVCEWTVVFTNDTSERSGIISEIRGMDGTLPMKEATLWNCSGEFYSAESYTARYDQLEKQMTFTPSGGRSCEGAFPYYRFLDGDGGVILAIGWPGKWDAVFTPEPLGVHVSCGQETIATYLEAGESIRSSATTLLFFAGDEDCGINLWRRWFNAHILPMDYNGGIKSRIGRNYNGGGVEFTKATEINQLSAFGSLLENPARPDVWWVDAGWYPCLRENGRPEWRKTGTWKPDPERFPEGFGMLGKTVEEAGAELLLWFEPERVRRGTELFDEHREWIAENPNAEKKGTEDEDFLLDIGDPQCLAWLKERINSIVSEGNVKIYRQDFNFDPLEYWRAKETEERKGFIENRHIRGLLEFWDDLLRRNPGLHIDAVAAGGRRLDMDVIRRTIPLHPTDYGYGEHPIKLAFHQVLSEWFPYYRSSVLNWEDETGYKRGGGKAELSGFVLNCCIAPMIQLEHMDYGEFNGYEAKAVEMFRAAADYLIWGDYYKLTEYSHAYDVWFARQFDFPERKEGLLQVIRLRDAEQESLTVKLKGIDRSAVYRLTDLESGEEQLVEGSILADGMEFFLEKRSARLLRYLLT